MGRRGRIFFPPPPEKNYNFTFKNEYFSCGYISLYSSICLAIVCTIILRYFNSPFYTYTSHIFAFFELSLHGIVNYNRRILSSLHIYQIVRHLYPLISLLIGQWPNSMTNELKYLFFLNRLYANVWFVGTKFFLLFKNISGL